MSYMYCVACGNENDFMIREEKEIYPVRNEDIQIIAKVTYCKHCGKQVWNEELDSDNLDQAYREYRKIHSLLQPEQIKDIREKYDLTQMAFAKILGLGDKTIARYEGGSIQDTAQNNLIMLAEHPNIFQILLKRSANVLSESEYKKASNALDKFRPVVINRNATVYKTDESKFTYKMDNIFFGGTANGKRKLG